MLTRTSVLIVLVFVFARYDTAIAGDELTKADIPANVSPEVKSLVEQTFSDEAKIRSQAAKQLGAMGESAAPAVPFLLRLMKDDTRVGVKQVGGGYINITVATTAGEALGGIGEPAVEGVVALFNESYSAKRQEMVKVLARFKDPRAIDALTGVLSDKDDELRRTTMIYLGGCSDPRVVPHLVASLKDANVDVRCFAADNLGKINDPAIVPALLEALADETLADKQNSFRRDVVTALGEQKDSRAVPALLKIVQDRKEDGFVSYWAACSLGEIGDLQAIDPLLAILKDRDAKEDLRIGAVSGLGHFRETRAVDALISVSRAPTENVKVRVGAILGLGERQGEKALPLLESLAKSATENDTIRFRAALTIVTITDGAIDDPDLVPPLGSYGGERESITGMANRVEARDKALNKIADHGKSQAARAAAVRMIRRLRY